MHLLRRLALTESLPETLIAVAEVGVLDLGEFGAEEKGAMSGLCRTMRRKRTNRLGSTA
jgi:hypothetical protein